MATTKWIQIEGWVLIILGGILLLSGIRDLDMTYMPGPGPGSRYAKALGHTLHIVGNSNCFLRLETVAKIKRIDLSNFLTWFSGRLS